MTLIAACLEPVVQGAHAEGGLDIDGVLRRDFLGAVAGNEGEVFDVFVKVSQPEGDILPSNEIVEPKARKVRDEHITRQVALRQAFEIVDGLGKGALEIGAGAFVLDEQHALPESIDTAIFQLLASAAELDLLFEAGDALAVDTEDGEKLVPEALRLGALGGLIRPAA
ncbi:MAG: hypothetical protein N3C63_05090 [Rhodocyclaceae bacterium]|nr:hypothetical protein [Rhodocyclaceae bacterium]